ncbi:hypothetical protein JCM10212_007040 [Sporobolomyces blumeae]
MGTSKTTKKRERCVTLVDGDDEEDEIAVSPSCLLGLSGVDLAERKSHSVAREGGISEKKELSMKPYHVFQRRRNAELKTADPDMPAATRRDIISAEWKESDENPKVIEAQNNS